jgi:hypothetical protein
MGLRLAYSDNSQSSKPSTTRSWKNTKPSVNKSPGRSYTSDRLWARKLRRLGLKNPRLRRMIEDMTDNFLENGISVHEAQQPPPKVSDD